MSQADLANEIGVTQAAVSYWEKGLRLPELEVLERLASALDVLPYGLTDNVATTTPMFRAAAIEKKRDEHMIEGRAEWARMAASRILREVELNPARPWPSEDDPLGDVPDDAAAALRRVWRIPRGPIPNLTTFIEAAGAIVLRVDFGHPKVDAAYAQPRRDAKRWILVNTLASNDWARQRLTLAHELGHAVLHHWDAFNVPDETGREAQAYRFALALMVPADEFILDIAHTRRRWDDFLRLRPKWGISAAALARRARDLKLVDEKSYRSLNIARRARGHWTQEPGNDGELERPTIFPEAVALLRKHAGWADAAFSEASGLPYERLADLLPEDFPVHSEPLRPVTLKRIK
jgi:Zn-dependent peptidase ImmA (M78 family)/transcriptional regulator with XRE-family HTH domain